MDFREYAAKETSELTARLTKAATAAAEQAAKQVSDEAQKVADALRAQLKTAVDEKTAVAGSLKDAQTHVERLSGELKEAQTQAERVRGELKDAQGHGERLRGELKDAQGQAERLRGELKDAQGQAERLRGELKSTTDRVDAAARQLDEQRKAADKLETARTELTAARDEQTNARRAAEADLRKTREALESLRTEMASAMKTLEKAAAERLASEEVAAAANSQSQAAEVKLAAVTDLLKKNAARVKSLEQAQLESQRRVQELESKTSAPHVVPAGPSATAMLDELLTGFQALAGATTISEVLTTLVEQMAAQFPRVALFRVKKGHLQGEHQIGFDLQNDIGKLVLPLGMDSLPSRAASSGQIESLTGNDLKNSRTPFNGTPTCALAIPIVVAGDTLAIVYADDSGAPKRGRGASADDVQGRYAAAMQQYAVAVLMRLSNELKTLAELRKYAISLLNEIEQMYNADVEGGLGAEDLRKRLAGNIDYARSIYGSRTALESADAATLIDEELTSFVDARKGTPFARDLAAAAGQAEASEQRSAEAS